MNSSDLHRVFEQHRQSQVRVTFKDGATGETGTQQGRLDSLSLLDDKIMVALGQPETEHGGIIFFVTDHVDSELFVETM